MSLNASAKKRILLMGRILSLVLLAVAAVLSRRSTVYLDPYGLLFVVVGGAAGALMTFSGGEIRAAFAHAGGALGSADEVRRSALFWEASARNFWMLGVLRSILSFVISLGSLSGGLAALTSGLADSLLAALYGMVLTVICYVPYWKLEGQHRRPRPPDRTAAPALPARGEIRNWKFSHIVGYALFVAILVSTLLRPPVTEIGAAVGWIVYWPSLLVVFGGTLALLLFLGDAAHESALSPGFAVTGMIGSLMGFVQVLLGISAGSIEDVSSALTFILSSCFAALMGMFLLGAPLEDRAAKGLGETARTPLSRVAWYVFPLLALVFLVAVFLLVVTPFEKHQ
jgi:hypothetical protein